MTEPSDARQDELAQYEQARSEFVASVGQRVEALRDVLDALLQRPTSGRRRDNLLRRVHAMAAAARVLGLHEVAQALGGIESLISSDAEGVGGDQLARVSRALDALPNLARAGAGAAAEPPADLEAQLREGALPITVLVFGTQSFVKALRDQAAFRFEIARAEDLPTARDLAQAIGPDAVLIDADLRGARELIEALLRGTLVDAGPVLVIGTFDSPDAASEYVTLGVARVLAKPVPPDTLVHALAQVIERPPREFGREPLGDVTMQRLGDRLADEIRRGLVDAVEPGCEDRSATLGDGADILAAVWGAVARVRELVTLRSGGTVRFDARGPEGAVTIAPWLGRDRVASDRKPGIARDPEAVPLQGRRVVIADDDPAVVWFLSGLLSNVGMEVLEAHDGRRAFELACTTWPDVVVSDVLMPERDGFTLCRDIKRDVAVRDTPVILLSWKEDLLRRVRELGADADGYLRKEASASAVVHRVREVLRTRARVEQRLAHGGEVQGRVDGLTPRLLLQLTCEKARDATVSVRDALYVYEVQIRDGQLRAATRTGVDGEFVRGEKVLAGLLGVGSGRFVVSPDATPCPAHFEGELEEVLAGPIRAARAAAHALELGALSDVARVEFDAGAVAAYVSLSPEPARTLARRLIEGAAPRDLLLTERVDASLLEAVLADLARHGGVRAVRATDGRDLLRAFDVTAQAPPQLTPAPPEILTPSPMFMFRESSVLSAAAGATAEAAPPPGVPLDGLPPEPEEPPEPLRAELPPVEPNDPNEPPERISLLDGGWEASSGEGDRTTFPGMGSGTPVLTAPTPAATAQPRTPEPQAEEAQAEPTVDPHATPLAPEAALPTPALPDPTREVTVPEPAAPDPGARAAHLISAMANGHAFYPDSQLSPKAPLPSAEAPAPPADAQPEADMQSEPIVVRKVARPPKPAAHRRLGAPARPAAAPGDVAVETVRATPASADADEAKSARVEPDSPPAPPRGLKKPKAALGPEADALPVKPVTIPPRPKAKAGMDSTMVSDAPPLLPQPEPPEDLAGTMVSDAPDAAPDISLGEADGSLDDLDDELRSAVEEDIRKESERPGPVVEDDADSVFAVGAAPAAGGSGPLPQARRIAFPRTADARRASALDEVSGAVDKTQAEPDETPLEAEAGERRSRPSPPLVGAAKTAGITLAAAALSFAVVSVVRSWVAPPADLTATAAAPSASAPVAPAAARSTPAQPAAAPSAQPEPVVDDLALPPGIEVAEGMGLLEVDTGDRHSIYVGGAFVGRGPIRRVPLDPGTHQVRVRLGADETEYTVTITKGRRARLGLAPSR